MFKLKLEIRISWSRTSTELVYTYIRLAFIQNDWLWYSKSTLHNINNLIPHYILATCAPYRLFLWNDNSFCNGMFIVNLWILPLLHPNQVNRPKCVFSIVFLIESWIKCSYELFKSQKWIWNKEPKLLVSWGIVMYMYRYIEQDEWVFCKMFFCCVEWIIFAICVTKN